jgi:hypothetical protein
MNAPMISSVGPPPDLHAERVVTEMLRYLNNEYERLRARGDGIINPHQMGTPKAQERTVARLRKAVGDMVLEIHLDAAKRGKFFLTITDWQVWDPALSEPVKGDRPAPASAGLVAVVSVYAGAGRRPMSKCATALVVTRHAWVRLAQRAQVRTIGDLIAAMRKLWSMMVAFVECVGGARFDSVAFWCAAFPSHTGRIIAVSQILADSLSCVKRTLCMGSINPLTRSE